MGITNVQPYIFYLLLRIKGRKFELLDQMQRMQKKVSDLFKFSATETFTEGIGYSFKRAGDIEFDSFIKNFLLTFSTRKTFYSEKPIKISYCPP